MKSNNHLKGAWRGLAGDILGRRPAVATLLELHERNPDLENWLNAARHALANDGEIQEDWLDELYLRRRQPQRWITRRAVAFRGEHRNRPRQALFAVNVAGRAGVS